MGLTKEEIQKIQKSAQTEVKITLSEKFDPTNDPIRDNDKIMEALAQSIVKLVPVILNGIIQKAEISMTPDDDGSFKGKIR